MHNFQMHENLLRDVITRQAGTLSKALVEGVMNAVDANATRIDITTDIEADTIRITDNGCGFTNEDQIHRVFGVFGQPQDVTEEKTFGTFRMGRGQLFAQGINTWRSGKYEMYVDVSKSLGYEIRYLDEPVPGCDILIQRYTSTWPLSTLSWDIGYHLAYLSVPVYVNGSLISAKDAKWDIQLPEGRIAFTSKGTLNVYNQGVRVSATASSLNGVSADVCSNLPLRVNFARNEVMSECPVWAVLLQALTDHHDNELFKSTHLTDDARIALIRDFYLRKRDIGPFLDHKLLRSVSGHKISINRLLTGYTHVMVAPANDHSRRINSMNRSYFVLDAADLPLWNLAETSNSAHFIDTLRDLLSWSLRDTIDNLIVVDYETPTEGDGRYHRELTPEEWQQASPVALAWLRVANDINLKLAKEIGCSSRRLTLGTSRGFANGWTNGRTQIVLDISYLDSLGYEPINSTPLVLLLVHEYLHDNRSTDMMHEHSTEFYEAYHNVTIELRNVYRLAYEAAYKELAGK